MGTRQRLLPARGPSRVSTGLQAQQPRLTLGPWAPWDPAAWASFPLGNELQQDTQGPGHLVQLHFGEDCSGVDESVFSPEEGVGCGHRAGHGPFPSPLLLPVCDRSGPRRCALLPAGGRTPPPWEPKILPRALPHSRVWGGQGRGLT